MIEKGRTGFLGFIVPILLIVGLLVGGAAAIVSRSLLKENKLSVDRSVTSSNSPIPSSSPPSSLSENQSIVEQLKSSIDGWTTYTNAAFGFSIEYPKEWILNTGCEKYGAIYFGYSGETAGKCEVNLEQIFKKNLSGLSFGMVSIEKEDGSIEETKQELARESDLSKFPDNSENVTTIGWKEAIRIAGTASQSDNPLFPNGTRFIFYIVKISEKEVLTVSYYQRPEWQEKSEIFERMVKSVKFQ